jgi:hypothetical protein
MSRLTHRRIKSHASAVWFVNREPELLSLFVSGQLI